MPVNSEVNFGLIGSGWMGSHHAANIQSSPFAELVAVASLDTESAQALVSGASNNGKVYSDYQKLLADPDVDAVVIASPNALHAEHAIAAAQAQKHIYLEKPMAITLEDCRGVAKAIEESGVKCAMGYHRRFNPLAQHAMGLLQSGQLGEIVLAESEYVHYVPGDWGIWDWLGKTSIAGSLIHAGTGHNIDLLRYFCGEVAEVSCFKEIRMPRKTQVETEDVAIINLRFENGALGRAVMFIGPITPFRFTLKIYGTHGTVDQNSVCLDTLPNFDQPDTSIQLPQSWIPDNVQGGISETWDKCLHAFIDDIRLDRQPSNDAVSGFNTAAVCFAAVESASTGAVIKPEVIRH